MPSVSNENVAPAVNIEVPSQIAATQPHVAPIKHRSNIIDTRYMPLSKIIVNAEGSPWPVEMFNQVIGADDELNPPSVNQLPIYQQYIHVKEMELRVIEPLTEVIDPETQSTTMRGSSLVYPSIIVNAGDVIFADIGDGREGVFLVNDSDKGSSFNEAMYKITYTLIDYGSGTADYRTPIEARVVNTKYFSKELLTANRNPLLIESDHISRDEVLHRYRQVVRNYFTKFINNDFRTILMPRDDTMRVYDRFIVKFLHAILDTVDHPEVCKLTPLNMGEANELDSFTLWRTLLELDPDLIPMSHQKFWAVSVVAFIRNPFFASLRYGGMHLFLYPDGKYPGIETEVSAASGAVPWTVIGEDHEDFEAYPVLPNFISDLNDTGITVEPPMIHPVNRDDYYVLSEEFYTNTEGQSALELILRRAMANETIKHSWLIELAKASTTWSDLDQFYYGPILMMLLKNSTFNF